MSAPTWRQGWAALAVSTLSRIVLGAVALLLAASVLPALVGWQSSVVLSGSMEPTLSPGDVAVVRPVDPAALRPGQVVLVDDPDVPGRLRLHRLVAVDGEDLLLKGDANPQADGTPTDRTAVHGVVTLALPWIGRPAVWLADGRVWPLVGTGAGLAVLLALALAHRRPEDDEDPPAPGPRRTPRSLARVLRRGTVAGAAVLLTVALPGAAAAFSSTTTSPALTIPVAPWWTCSDVGGSTGAKAVNYFRLQEQWGTVATNTGSPATAGDATYSSSGVTQGVAGPACGAGETAAVRLDGSTGALWTSQLVTNPQTFSVQVWFNTTTTSGGKLIGFGNTTNGGKSSQYDRHVYMTGTGQLVFGVYPGGYQTITSPGSYNNGAWHLVTATFSASTGMRLYVDGALVASNAAVTSAEAFDGYWRIGYDNVDSWPSSPASAYFAGSLAGVSTYGTALTATQVSQAWAITR